MRSAEEGYTLIEALVSLAILSGTILVAFEIFATSLRAIRSTEARQQLLLAVEREITDLRMRPYLSEQRIEGKWESGRWQILVSPIQFDASTGFKGFRPYRVTAVKISEGMPTRAILDTILLGQPTP